MLRAIRPWLVTKAKEADLALEFAATMSRGGKPVAKRTLAKRARLAAALRREKHLEFTRTLALHSLRRDA